MALIINKKTNYILLVSLVTIILVGIIGLTFAYFRARVVGNGTDSLMVAGTLGLEFTDDEAYSNNTFAPGDTITRTISVKNTGEKYTYYKIGWSSLTNTFLNGEIQIELKCKQYLNYGTENQEESGTCSGLIQEPIKSIDDPIKDNIFIGFGYTHEYEINVSFVEINDVQDYNLTGEFRAVMDVSGSVDSAKWYNNCNGSDTLNCKMITDSTPQSDAYLNYAVADSIANLYYTYDENMSYDITNDGLGERVYFYRGRVNNNYVSFGGFCWKIIRTNEDGSVRMRYNGALNGGACTATATAINAISYKYLYYNYESGDARYAGYMYGETCNTYEECTQNEVESDIKKTIDLWYENYLIDYKDQISDQIFCNDRSLSSGAKYINIANANTGFGTAKSFYGIAARYFNTTSYALSSIAYPTFKCPRVQDSFTVSDVIGNGDLKYPVALITADEARIAGLPLSDTGSASGTYYLNNNMNYWTMTPLFQNGTTSNMNYIKLDSIYYKSASTTAHVIPVISLKKETVVVSGTGGVSTPYVIESEAE